MNAWHFFAYLYTHFDATFLGWVQQTASRLAGGMQRPIIAAVTIYIAGLAALEVFDPSGNPMSFLVRKLIRGGIVIAAATAANYSDLFGNFVLNTLPNDITSAVSGATGGAANIAPETFDKMFGQTWVSANEAYKNVSGWSAKSFGLVCCIMLYMLFCSLAIGLAFMIFMAGHILLGLCVVIGPLFIPCLLWAWSTHIFNNWIAALGTLILAQVFLVALLSMMVVVDGDLLQQISTMNGSAGFNASDEMGQLHLLMEALILSAGVGFFAGMTPLIAARIFGGIAAEVAPLTRMASGAISSTVGVIAQPSGGAAANGARSAAGMRSLQPAGRAP